MLLRSSLAFCLKEILTILSFLSVQFLKVFFEMKVFYFGAIQAFLNGISEYNSFAFFVFQKAKSSFNYFTNAFISSGRNLGLDKLVEIISELYGCVFTHFLIFSKKIGKISIFLAL